MFYILNHSYYVPAFVGAVPDPTRHTRSLLSQGRVARLRKHDSEAGAHDAPNAHAFRRYHPRRRYWVFLDVVGLTRGKNGLLARGNPFVGRRGRGYWTALGVLWLG